MTSGGSDGATRLNPARDVQGASDEVQVIRANSGNSNHSNQTGHEFEIPITNIDDILSEMSLCSDRNKCTTVPALTLSEEVGLQVHIQSSSQDRSTSDGENEKAILHMNQLKEESSEVLKGAGPERPDAGYEYMYPQGDDSDPNSDSTTDSSLKVNTMASGDVSPHKLSSDEEEVEFCSCDAQQTAASVHSHLSQSSNASSHFQQARTLNTNLDQNNDVLPCSSDVSLTNSFRAPLCSQLPQSLGVSSTEEPCHTSSTISVSSIEFQNNRVIEPCDKHKARLEVTPGSRRIHSSLSPEYAHTITQGTRLHAHDLLNSDSLKQLNTVTSQSPSWETKTSVSSIDRSDTKVSSSVINKEKVLECKTNSISNTSSCLKTSSLKLLNKSDCPVWSSNFKLQDEIQIQLNSRCPGLKGLSIKSKIKPQKHTRSESPVFSKDNSFSNQPTKLPPTANMSSFLKTNNYSDLNSCLALPKVIERRHNMTEHGPSGGTLHTVQLAMEKDIYLDPKVMTNSPGQSHPPATQRTFIEVQLSASSSPVMARNDIVNSKNSKHSQISTDARLTPMASSANSVVERTNGTVNKMVPNSIYSTKKCNLPTNTSLKPSTILETSETPKSSTSRLYIKAVERRSLFTDTALSVNHNPFSVQHKIKSFENLANFDKPVAKNSDSQSYALAYRASLNQRIAGYLDLVNSTDCRARQRNFSSYMENLIPTTSCSTILGKTPSSITLINLEPSYASFNTTLLTEDSPETEVQKAPDGVAPETPPVLRRKHAKLPRSRLRQLRALSMPELGKLCTVDLSRIHGTIAGKTEMGTVSASPEEATVTVSGPPSSTLSRVTLNRVSRGNPGSSEDSPQGNLETLKQPGWSIR